MGIWFQYVIVEGPYPSVRSLWTVMKDLEMEGMTLESLRTLSTRSGMVISKGEAIHNTKQLSSSVWRAS